jgi:hypothetical protein
MTDIPQWAKERAVKMTAQEGGPLYDIADPRLFSTYPEGGYRNQCVVAFARYIAEHEDPPVDPLLIEAREICALDCEKFRLLSSAGNYRRGVNDKGDTLRVVITALKRGIELGKQP